MCTDPVIVCTTVAVSLDDAIDHVGNRCGLNHDSDVSAHVNDRAVISSDMYSYHLAVYGIYDRCSRISWDARSDGMAAQTAREGMLEDGFTLQVLDLGLASAGIIIMCHQIGEMRGSLRQF